MITENIVELKSTFKSYKKELFILIVIILSYKEKRKQIPKLVTKEKKNF